jgi:hypothetical protein
MLSFVESWERPRAKPASRRPPSAVRRNGGLWLRRLGAGRSSAELGGPLPPPPPADRQQRARRGAGHPRRKPPARRGDPRSPSGGRRRRPRRASSREGPPPGASGPARGCASPSAPCARPDSSASRAEIHVPCVADEAHRARGQAARPFVGGTPERPWPLCSTGLPSRSRAQPGRWARNTPFGEPLSRRRLLDDGFGRGPERTEPRLTVCPPSCLRTRRELGRRRERRPSHRGRRLD